MPEFQFGGVTALLVQIAVIVLTSRAIGFVTRRLGQPLIVAEVLAGIFLGPSILGRLAPGVASALFPASSLQTMSVLSQIGLVLFMFVVGLELDPRLLKARTHAVIAISHTSILLPFILGVGSSFWLRETYAGPEVPALSFALFLGVSMSVTAFPVLARILTERELLTSRIGAIAIACAAVDDVTAWCLLAVVVAVARRGDLLHAGWTVVLTGGFVAIMWMAMRPVLGLVGRAVERRGPTNGLLAVVLLFLTASAIITESIGVHALFGAFLCGVVVPRESKLLKSLVERLETVAVVLLLPLFFAYSGLRTELGLLRGPSEWLAVLIITALATAGKFGGSAIAARLSGLPWREASAVGILMNTRGLVELIVLNVGLDLHIISPALFTMLVIMALVTTMATTPILRWVYADEEMAAYPANTLAEAVPPRPLAR